LILLSPQLFLFLDLSLFRLELLSPFLFCNSLLRRLCPQNSFNVISSSPKLVQVQIQELLKREIGTLVWPVKEYLAQRQADLICIETASCNEQRIPIVSVVRVCGRSLLCVRQVVSTKGPTKGYRADCLNCQVLLQPTTVMFDVVAAVLMQEELRPLEDVAAEFHG
jgi:hypothetical protein